MKQCAFCAAQRADNNLWCQQPQCPAENAVERLRTGDRIGEMEIISWVVTLPAATVYRATRHGKPVLLKVAHPSFEDKLKREARFLLAHRHPVLPRLCSAHSDMSVTNYPYGRIAIDGQQLTYLVLADIEGRTLTEWLTRNPQPWHKYTCWIVGQIAACIQFIHQCGMFHLTVSTALVLIRFDAQHVPRPILIDLGVCAPFEDVARSWNPLLLSRSAAALPPDKGQLDIIQAEARQVGLLLQQMLVGSVDQLQTVRDDIRALSHLAQRALNPSRGQDRPFTLPDFLNTLWSICPAPPEEKVARPLKLHLVRYTALLLTAVAVLSLLLMVATG